MLSPFANIPFRRSIFDALWYHTTKNTEACVRALVTASILAKTNEERNEIADFVKKYGIKV